MTKWNQNGTFFWCVVAIFVRCDFFYRSLFDIVFSSFDVFEWTTFFFCWTTVKIGTLWFQKCGNAFFNKEINVFSFLLFNLQIEMNRACEKCKRHTANNSIQILWIHSLEIYSNWKWWFQKFQTASNEFQSPDYWNSIRLAHLGLELCILPSKLHYYNYHSMHINYTRSMIYYNMSIEKVNFTNSHLNLCVSYFKVSFDFSTVPEEATKNLLRRAENQKHSYEINRI